MEPLIWSTDWIPGIFGGATMRPGATSANDFGRVTLLPVRKAADPNNYYDRLGAATIRALRLRHPSVSSFAAAIARELGWKHLSRQAIYDWETAHSRVPLSVLLAACSVGHLRLDEAITAGIQFLPPIIS
jgi:hypothetical protein